MRWPRRERHSKIAQTEQQRYSDPLHLVSLRLKTCEDALRKNPDDPDALFTKAVFLARIREYKRAIDCLRRVTSLEPEYPMVWGLMSLIYSRMGDYRNAKSCREKSIAAEI
jgi:tetratricopeptide (TPR) repeat protein